MITFDRAIEILKPETTRYSPEEYEEALRLARMALRMMREHNACAEKSTGICLDAENGEFAEKIRMEE